MITASVMKELNFQLKVMIAQLVEFNCIKFVYYKVGQS